ncbi:hypothetical protein LXA43DRAFT_1060411 [Ganoderma leucocontextum]|nr:hypothetical protein LXA43DRAFT_1060411 [Ganoderma leucocontextum]
MATAQLNPAYIPDDHSSLSYSQPIELGKACIAPTSSATHALLVDEGLRTLVANLTLDDATLGELREGDRKSPSAGEHEVDKGHSPPSLREQSEKSPRTDSGDPAGLAAPIDPPNLPRPVHHSVAKADEELPPTAENGDEGVARMASQRPERSVAPAPERVGDVFSLSGLATLRTFIPDDLFPDDLLVHDPDNITKPCPDLQRSPSHVPVRYVRIFPNLKASGGALRLQSAFPGRSPDHPVRTAHLYLKADNRLGTGNHSSVFSAPLRLRLDPESGEESTVRVAAKTASGQCGAHQMLHLEAVAYDAFPRCLMDDKYLGTTVSSATTATSNGVSTDADATCSVPWPTRILLVEECGKPIEPHVFPQEHRLRCLQLVKRLHAAGFAQGSMHVRNVVVQPGPLFAPPGARSYATPSFRIIDFGRGVVLSHIPPPLQWAFSELCKVEEWRAHRVLELCRATTELYAQLISLYS